MLLPAVLAGIFLPVRCWIAAQSAYQVFICFAD
jgi:hypothetical protein